MSSAFQILEYICFSQLYDDNFEASAVKVMIYIIHWL